MKNSIIPQIILSSLIAAVITAGIVSAATTIGTNINTTGTLTVSGTTALNGITYTWPGSQAASAYLQTDGAGALSWAAITTASPDWVKETNYGVLNLTASTTIPYWAKDAIYASSTLQVAGNAIFESNLGIGTSSPYAKLSVVGEVVAEYFTATSTTATTTLAGGFAVETSGLVYDYSSNNVGIGTAAPDYALDVAGDMGVNENIFHNGDSDTYIDFDATDRIFFRVGSEGLLYLYEGTQDYVAIGDGGDVDLYFGGLSSPALFVQGSSFNVGIGTTSPATPMDIYTTATTTITLDSSSATQGGCLKIKNATTTGYIYCISNGGGLQCSTTSCEN